MIKEWIQKFPVHILIIAVVAVYGNSLFNEYALDDAIVITQNNFVKKGIDGIDEIFTTESFTGFFGFDKKLVAGGRYRPFSIATFALEYEFFGKNPFISHLINILLYALVVVLIFKLLKNNARFSLNPALIAALLYALHPLHTEAVANIKGRDEILSFLFVLLAMRFLFKSKLKAYFRYGIAALLMFLAMLTKEHAISFVVLAPLAFFYLKKPKKEILGAFLAVFIPAIVFFVIRFQVLGGLNFEQSPSLMNNPFVNMDMGEKYATILLTWLWYVRLLVFPHPLTYDYYPYHVPVTDFADFYPWIGIIMVAALLFFAVKSLKDRKAYGFWIWFFIGTFFLMSNLFISVGTFMNERFMFMPSISYCIAVALGLNYLLKNPEFKKLGIALLVVFGVGYSVKTVTRNNDWKNDFTLFTHDVKISQNSAKGNCVAGGKYYEKGRDAKDKSDRNRYLQKAHRYLQKSLQIHPTYNDAHLLMGNTKFGIGKPLDSCMVHYYSVLSRAPRHANAWKNALAVLQNGKPEKRLMWYEKLYKIDPNRYEVNYQIGNISGRYMNDIPAAEKFLKRALKIKPNSVKALKDLAVVYGLTKRYGKSIEYLQKVVELDPKDDGAWYNLGLSLNATGKLKEAQKAFDKAHELNPKRKKVSVVK